MAAAPFITRADSTARETAPRRLSPDELDLIRSMVREELEAYQSDHVSIDYVKEMMRQLEARIERRITEESAARRLGTSRAASERVPAMDAAVERAIEPVAEETESTPRTGLLAEFAARDFEGLLPFLGIRVSDAAEKLVLGVRADYRFTGRSVRFLPEVGVALGSDIGITALANAAWAPIDVSDDVEVYVGAGAGFATEDGLNGFDFLFHLFLGAETEVGSGHRIFGELGTMNLFDSNRLIVGYRFDL
jgi:hypothetical protein